MKNFIVVQVFDGFEFVVADQINSDKRGLAFSPSLRTYSHRSRYTKAILYDIKPMFEGYVFVQFPTDEINFAYLSKVNGVIDVIYTGEHPSEIRPRKMLEIVLAEVERERLSKPSAKLNEDLVTKKLKLVIESGSFAGVEGEVLSYDPDKNNLTIQAKFFGENRDIVVDASLIPDFSPVLLEAMEK